MRIPENVTEIALRCVSRIAPPSARWRLAPSVRAPGPLVMRPGGRKHVCACLLSYCVALRVRAQTACAGGLAASGSMHVLACSRVLRCVSRIALRVLAQIACTGDLAASGSMHVLACSRVSRSVHGCVSRCAACARSDRLRRRPGGLRKHAAAAAAAEFASLCPSFCCLGIGGRSR